MSNYIKIAALLLLTSCTLISKSETEKKAVSTNPSITAANIASGQDSYLDYYNTAEYSGAFTCCITGYQPPSR